MTPALAHSLKRPLLGSAALNFSAVTVLLLLCAWMLQVMLAMPPAYIVKALVVFTGGSLLFVPLLLHHHPFSQFGAANRMTLLRGMLVALLAGFLGEPVSTATALTLVATGLLTLVLDGFDGRIARKTGMTSVFGARFDMETDAVLVLLFSAFAWQTGKAGAWVILGGLLRYLFLAAGWIVPWMRAPLPFSRRRQTICVVQIAVMLAVMLPFVRSPWSDLLAALSLAVLAGSFLADIGWLARNAGIGRWATGAGQSRNATVEAPPVTRLKE